ncbi:ABC transporter substrate-binding protein [Rhodococcus artemisiae]|uniref:ABC transporter substrate-binding protein n=1 Tax=Rhodococcus artemisiae TaxID=714159 RepID=A0ABU7L407_9NOCA|nr:ABC transporter substrate-binding protein [Rhodococcus artemisiae]MEE2056280.1 ABC transporter substrate-binding protein [Rhodococcus artemisiae]
MAASERNERRPHTRRSRFSRRMVVVGAALAAAAATTVACSTEEEPLPSIGYMIDNTVTGYNANTVDGAASGAPQALARVLPGFGYVGPAGRVIADTDIGTATAVPGEQLTVQYRLSPGSVYSDGVPMSCDDLVLTWAAASGRFTESDESGAESNLFDAALRGGYADIERIDCAPGSKDATVVFRPGRGDTDWRSLFGATALMPSHVAARASGVTDLVGVLTGDDADAVRPIAEFWNTGWTLTPGALDPTLLPSSGPYRIESYTAEDGLVLVANERWWGNPPGTDRIVVWPRGTAAQTAAEEGQVQVVDSADGALGHTSALGETVDAATVVSRNLEQLILATNGVFENPAARRALASCVPRQQLFDELGAATDDERSGPVGSRLLPIGSPLYPLVSGPSERFDTADLDVARTERERSGQERIQVRIGYTAPDMRRARTVELIAQSCRDAGIDVVDAGSETFLPSQLDSGEIDAVLSGTAGVSGAGGRADMEDARSALNSRAGSNIGGYANGRIDEILAGLLVAGDNATVLGLAEEGERILWDEMPTLPLFLQPRTIGFAPNMHSAVANPTAAGAGWNMDRWILTG